MPLDPPAERALDRAAELLSKADGIVVAVGASLAVAGGALDPRGPASRGFRLGARPQVEELAHPRWFERDPARAWAFYGRLLALSRTEPLPAALSLLHPVLGDRPRFLLTANADGRLQAAGFDEADVYELRGSVHHLQRVDGTGGTWPATGMQIELEPDGLRAREPLPRCPETGQPARPNVLMVGDWRWRDVRSSAQASAYRRWLAAHQGARIVVLELGLGPLGADLRKECERRHLRDSTLVRVGRAVRRVPVGSVFVDLEPDEAMPALAARLLG